MSLPVVINLPEDVTSDYRRNIQNLMQQQGDSAISLHLLQEQINMLRQETENPIDRLILLSGMLLNRLDQLRKLSSSMSSAIKVECSSE